MTSDPKCITCMHFKAYPQQFDSSIGECAWMPEAMPRWARFHLDNDDKFYGPRRGIHRHPQRHGFVKDCPAFEEAK